VDFTHTRLLEVTRESLVSTKFLHELYTIKPSLSARPRRLLPDRFRRIRLHTTEKHYIRWLSSSSWASSLLLVDKKIWYIAGFTDVSRSYENRSIPVTAPARFHHEFDKKKHFYEIEPHTSISSDTNRIDLRPQNCSYVTQGRIKGGGTGYNCPGCQYFRGAKILWTEMSLLMNF
jgi:hypothetical protein